MSVEAVLRHFNRAWSQRVGVLDESFLGSGRPIGPSRLLFELGAESVSVRELRDRTGLDSGYVSRLLRRLEREGLVSTEVDPQDARRRLVSLTTDGRIARQDLDDRSEQLARDLVQPLSDGQRLRLAEVPRLGRSPAARRHDHDRAGRPRCLAPGACSNVVLRRAGSKVPDGFDPGVDSLTRRISARLTAGCFLPVSTARRLPAAAFIASTPVRPRSNACGSTRTGAAPVSAAACCARSSRPPSSVASRRRPARHQQRAHRRRHDVPPGRVHRDRPVQRQPLRPPLVREVARVSPGGGAC